MVNVDTAVAAIARRHHGHFNREHLRLLGVSAGTRRHRLDAGIWLTPYEGVYRIAGAPLTWRGAAQAAVWAGGTRAAVSHRSAANVHGLPGGRDTFVEISCPRWRRTRSDGILVHETGALSDRDVTLVDGLAVTTVERTIFDLCAVCGPKTVDLAIDNALRRGLTTFDRLAATLRRVGKRGRRGTRRLRRLLAARDPLHTPTESEQEQLLRDVLRRHGFPPPVNQYEVRDEHGQFLARVDVAYPRLTIAIEYESYQEHVGTLPLVRDSRRRNALLASGWIVLAATAEDVRYGQGHALATELRRAIALAHRRLAPTANRRQFVSHDDAN